MHISKNRNFLQYIVFNIDTGNVLKVILKASFSISRLGKWNEMKWIGL